MDGVTLFVAVCLRDDLGEGGELIGVYCIEEGSDCIDSGDSTKAFGSDLTNFSDCEEALRDVVEIEAPDAVVVVVVVEVSVEREERDEEEGV